MKIKDGFILREIAGNFIVIAIGNAVKDFNGVITLNETGAFLWTFFTENHTEEEGVDALCGEYEVAREQAAADVKKFADILKQNDFVD